MLTGDGVNISDVEARAPGGSKGVPRGEGWGTELASLAINID